MAAVRAALTLLVFALLQPRGLRAAPRSEFGAEAERDADVHFLRCNFTILFESGPRCDVQCQVDADNFLSYDCGRDIVKNVSSLGSRVSDTRTWKDQRTMLRDAGNLFKKQFIDIRDLVDSVLVSMQGRLTCQSEPNGHFYGFWEFGLNGQMLLIFNPKHKKWEVVRRGGKLLKEKWEKDTDMIQFLKMVSMGDCKKWLKMFEEHWDKEAPSTTNLSHDPILGVLGRNSTAVMNSAPSSTASSHDPTLGVLGRSSTAVMNSAPSTTASSSSHTKDKNTWDAYKLLIIAFVLFCVISLIHGIGKL